MRNSGRSGTISASLWAVAQYASSNVVQNIMHTSFFFKPFKMSIAIENPSDCEVRAVIWFLLAKNLKMAEIYCELYMVCRQKIMSESTVQQWCCMFKNGWTRWEKESYQWWTGVQKIDGKVCEDHQFTISELSEQFPQISLTVLYDAVTESLGYPKILCSLDVFLHLSLFILSILKWYQWWRG